MIYLTSYIIIREFNPEYILSLLKKIDFGVLSYKRRSRFITSYTEHNNTNFI